MQYMVYRKFILFLIVTLNTMLIRAQVVVPPKPLTVSYQATCYTYTSAMGKGKGVKLLIVLNDKRFSTKYFIPDILYVNGKMTAFIIKIKGSHCILEVNSYRSVSEPTLSTNGTIQVKGEDDPLPFTAETLYPSRLIFHHHTMTYSTEIKSYSVIKQ